jgi:hypothetical protein
MSAATSAVRMQQAYCEAAAVRRRWEGCMQSFAFCAVQWVRRWMEGRARRSVRRTLGMGISHVNIGIGMGRGYGRGLIEERMQVHVVRGFVREGHGNRTWEEN